MVFSIRLILALVLSLFTGKGGSQFDLDWGKNFSEVEVEQLALSAFFESYRQSHTFDHLSDQALRREIIRFWKGKRDHFDAHYVLAARLQGQLVGLAVYQRQDPQTVYLAELMTSPSCWGEGLGKKLILSIKEVDPSIKRVVLICEKANTKTVNFYRSMGFNPILEDPGYITFQKSLS